MDSGHVVPECHLIIPYVLDTQRGRLHVLVVIPAAILNSDIMAQTLLITLLVTCHCWIWVSVKGQRQHDMTS